MISPERNRHYQEVRNKELLKRKSFREKYGILSREVLPQSRIKKRLDPIFERLRKLNLIFDRFHVSPPTIGADGEVWDSVEMGKDRIYLIRREPDSESTSSVEAVLVSRLESGNYHVMYNLGWKEYENDNEPALMAATDIINNLIRPTEEAFQLTPKT